MHAHKAPLLRGSFLPGPLGCRSPQHAQPYSSCFRPHTYLRNTEYVFSELCGYTRADHVVQVHATAANDREEFLGQLAHWLRVL